MAEQVGIDTMDRPEFSFAMVAGAAADGRRDAVSAGRAGFPGI